MEINLSLIITIYIIKKFLTCGLFLMAPEDLKFFFQVADVEEFTEMVTRSCQQPVAIEIQLHLHHCVFVSMPASRQKQKQTVCPETDFSDTDKNVSFASHKYSGQ